MGDNNKLNFISHTIELAKTNLANPLGRPFGAIIVRDNIIVGEGVNLTVIKPDPTAHAEIEAIRSASKYLNSKYLNGCDLYTSCEPCPMCLAACYWANIRSVYYSASSNTATEFGFDDNYILDQLRTQIDKRDLSMIQLQPNAGLEPFELWKKRNDKTK
jgi:tRNA(Arg) A34 adenosine deaminase TadA